MGHTLFPFHAQHQATATYAAVLKRVLVGRACHCVGEPSDSSNAEAAAVPHGILKGTEALRLAVPLFLKGTRVNKIGVTFFNKPHRWR